MILCSEKCQKIVPGFRRYRLVFASTFRYQINQQVKQMWIYITPVGKQGLPADIGNAAVFLASYDSSFIVGTEILSDGGLTNISLMK
ncbi:SDR family oxidoreductase [Pedobacter sp. Leaf216]|uniref:SDR family oxidoreductase n=1 Tax=Pedobacter sp. Leaf216 TaxID=1735684 RepID=UPI0021008811|nr:SDR family oxidoreductase [Pedobacter sp. Leaf216]